LEKEKAFRKRVDKLVSKPNPTVAQIEALKFQARIHGWDQTGIPRSNGYIPVADRKPDAASPTGAPAESEAPPVRFSVGDTCQVDGKPYRVTAVGREWQAGLGRTTLMDFGTNSKIDQYVVVEGHGARALDANPKTSVEPLVEEA